MELNADFSQRASAHAAQTPWKPSPIPGVDRRMLDRIGDEVARATSIVRYAPGSQFSAHVHTGGEEFFVLDGVFQDEHGDFPAGSYIRNPPQSSHTPGSDQGCVIFVKLWQFDLEDRTEVKIDTNALSFQATASRPGVDILPLFQDQRETVSLERWAAGAAIDLEAPDGMEILVLDGGFSESGEPFEKHSWLRLPAGGAGRILAGARGARVWIKRGHLKEPPRAPITV